MEAYRFQTGGCWPAALRALLRLGFLPERPRKEAAVCSLGSVKIINQHSLYQRRKIKEISGNMEYGGIARGSSRVAVVINCQSVEDVLKMLKSRNVSYRGYAFVFQGETEANSDGSMPQVLASCA